ncbi:sulfite exporter TauE/SafE family protein [Falsirhodobacter sp. 1013]|uniref:sulfite exporter TauE/SafE family protein n=1 Tax=Falsirhodobacter sp. 1013 TaxID=3417566 RepID=UPI003EB76E9D
MHWNIYSSSTEFAVTLLAVFVVGLSKGGLGGMSLLGVPLMALVMPPVTAAAILLPVLVIMDIISVATWRRWADWQILRRILPFSVIGIGIGWATAELVSDSMVRLIVGLVSLAFVARAIFGAAGGGAPTAAARFWGGLAGYTSFVAHAGGPPLQIYMMPLRLDPKIFTGTTVMFFAITNALKLVPYAALGEFSSENLARSTVMLPLAVGATWLGSWTVRRMHPRVFYPFTYASVALVGIKLVWDGVAGL